MLPAPRRRDVLQLLLAGTAGLAVPRTARAGGPQRSTASHHTPLAPSRLSESVLLVSGGGGNVVVVTGADGLVLVNGGAQEHSAELLKLIAAQAGGGRVRTLFNTDWHPQHTGSNEALGKAGAQIIAHDNTKQYLANDQFVEWEKRTYKARGAAALPTKTFFTTGTMSAGRERVQYGHLGSAHTDGDIYVFLPESNVLVAGDVMTVGTYPIADYTSGGWLGGLMTATKTLLDLATANTRIVPGTGPVQTKADLQAQFDMLTAMRDRFAKMMRQGMGVEDMLANAATKEFDAKWGDPALFVSTSYRGLWLHVRELGGIV
jgi:glyoxylase-like metal-dependent hydrolase (beta-lactamase superfamily II)